MRIDRKKHKPSQVRCSTHTSRSGSREARCPAVIQANGKGGRQRGHRVLARPRAAGCVARPCKLGAVLWCSLCQRRSDRDSFSLCRVTVGAGAPPTVQVVKTVSPSEKPHPQCKGGKHRPSGGSGTVCPCAASHVEASAVRTWLNSQVALRRVTSGGKYSMWSQNWPRPSGVAGSPSAAGPPGQPLALINSAPVTAGAGCGLEHRVPCTEPCSLWFDGDCV